MAANPEILPEIQMERRRAMCALLEQPLLRAVSLNGEISDEFLLVRRHANWLQQWFAEFPAWNLYVDRELARLRMLPADFPLRGDPARPAVDRKSGAAFTRRRYVALCLALAALEQLGRQTTLEHMVASIAQLDRTSHDQRRDLVHAIRLLLDLGVLRRKEGDEERFLQDGEPAGTAYEIQRHVLAQMLQTPRSPSLVESMPQRSREPSWELRAAHLSDPAPSARAQLFRALLTNPVLNPGRLSTEEQHFLEKNRNAILREFNEATGLAAEIRMET